MRSRPLFCITASILALWSFRSAAGQEKVHPDGTASAILYQGTEARLVTYPPPKDRRGGGVWNVPDKFHLVNYALSADGQRVWVVLSNGAFTAKDLRWQLWSLKTDGSDARESAFTPPVEVPDVPSILVSRDGSVAWLYARPPAGSPRSGHYVQQATVGGAARLIATDKSLKDLGYPTYPQLTADGKSLFFIENSGVMQLGADGAVKRIAAKKDITYQGKTLENEHAWNLAINSDGSQWAYTSRFTSLKGAPSVVVRQTRNGIRLHVDPTPNNIFWGVFNGVSISEDGETVLIIKGETDQKALLLWRGDKVTRVRADIPDNVWGTLSGNGKTLYSGAHGYPFVEDLTTGKRHSVMSGAITSLPRGDDRLSTDGTVLACFYPSGQGGRDSLYLFRAGAAHKGWPSIKSVRQRYDKNKLIVTVETEATDPPHRVMLVQLMNGYLFPFRVLPGPLNPLEWANYSGFSQDPKRPGVYQLPIDMSGKQPLLDDTFNFRLVVLNADGNRATFVDVPVLRDLHFHPFADFLKDVDKAKFEDYKGKPGVRVANAAEFNKMRDHILSLYKDVPITHTFVGQGGVHVDCITIDKQPGALAELGRGNKLQLAAPAIPGMPEFADGTKHPSDFDGLEGHLTKGSKDDFGKEMFCPEGSIPMRRVTLADMTRLPRFSDFFQKHETGSSLPPLKEKGKEKGGKGGGGGPSGHRYAHAAQQVENFGGSSWINLWRPMPTPNQFSLSQQWYAGGDPVQTVEGGWQVYPAFYGNSYPCLFVFWTADGYNNTGAYNLTKPGFIQVTNAYVLGAPWNRWSTPNSIQWGFRMTWYRDPANGNWWLFLGGLKKSIPVGYYPRALFGNGQLSKFATSVDYGGEVTGQTASGQMGSGAFAQSGFGRAAFQNNIFYFPTAGKSAWANLTPHMTNPPYYTIDLHNERSTWGTYFYYGGPGGP